LALALMVLWRVSIHWFLGHPDFGERILIVGSGNLAVEVAREVLDRPDAGYRIVGFVGTDADLLGKSLINPRVIGMTDQLDEIVKRENIDRIVVAMGERRGQLPTNKLLQLSLAGEVTIEEGLSFYERITGRVSLNMLRPSWLIFTGRRRRAKTAELSRSLVHWFVALMGAILSLPLVLLTAVLIKLESRGPVFYKQERVGKNGHTFVLMKFRSMRVDAEQDGPVWASKGDARTTRIGRIIRKVRIDEIPQFWNILKGEMTTTFDRAGINRLGANQVSLRGLDRRCAAETSVRPVLHQEPGFASGRRHYIRDDQNHSVWARCPITQGLEVGDD
jgi:hypothetical protein